MKEKFKHKHGSRYAEYYLDGTSHSANTSRLEELDNLVDKFEDGVKKASDFESLKKMSRGLIKIIRIQQQIIDNLLIEE